MAEFTPLEPPEQELEQALRGLQLAAAPLSEQELWYRAGARTARRRTNVWRATTAAVVVLATAVVVWRPKPATITVDRVVYVPQRVVPVHVATTTDAAPPASIFVSYFRLRDTVEQKGLDALPVSGGTGELDQPAQQAWAPALTSELVSTRG